MTRLLTALAAAGPAASWSSTTCTSSTTTRWRCSRWCCAGSPRRRSALLARAPAAIWPSPNPAAEELLDRLAERAELVRVELGTLARRELADVIAPVLGAPSGRRPGRASVHRRADGNPFFATEIARSLAESGLLAIDGGVARLARAAPTRSGSAGADAVLRRVVPLAPARRAVARTLAVLRRRRA